MAVRSLDGSRTLGKSLTVGDLVATPHLGLTVIAGASGLDRPVRWGHVCELEDPAPWLEGWELVMTTGLGVPADPAKQGPYIERMAVAQIAGLAISEDLLAPEIGAELIEAADRMAFPVVEVSIEVPFVALARTIAAANTDGAQRRLVTHVGIFDTLRAATVKGAAFNELLSRMADLTGYDLYLCSPNGHQILDGVEAPPPNIIERHLPRIAGQPPGIPGGYVVSIPLARRTVGLLVALERDRGDPAGLTAVQHVATVVALELSNRERELEVVRREGAETLSELLANTLDPKTARKRLILSGVDPGSPLVLAAVALNEGVEDSHVHRGLADRAVAHLIVSQRELYVLAAAERLDAFAELDGCTVGLSRPFPLDDGLGKARREALWALARIQDRADSVLVFPEHDEGATWLPTDAGSLHALVRSTLGAVLDADAKRGSELVRSLRVWLHHDRRTEAASRRLHIHKHTLAYRLKRVEELTGRDLARTADLAELWMALNALDIVGTGEAGPES